jgi:hypothetical protein
VAHVRAGYSKLPLATDAKRASKHVHLKFIKALGNNQQYLFAKYMSTFNIVRYVAFFDKLSASEAAY